VERLEERTLLSGVAPHIDTSFLDGTLSLSDGVGESNQLTLACDETYLLISDAARQFRSAPDGSTLRDGNRTLVVPLASLARLRFELGDGDDILSVDFTGGNPIPVGGLVYDGGAGDDAVALLGGDFARIAKTFVNGSSGVIDLDGAAIKYANLEPVLINVGTVDEMIFVLPAGGSTAYLEDDGTLGNDLSQLRSADAVPAFETTTFTNPTGSLAVRRGNAVDTLAIMELPDFDANLTIGSLNEPLSTITFSGAVELAADNGLWGYSAGTILLDAPGSDIATSGSGAVILNAARNIALNPGSSITCVDGPIGLWANYNEPAVGSQFAGISLTGATISASGTGQIQLLGRGGTVDGNNHGVRIDGGADVWSASGGVWISGVGGAGSGARNYGVLVSGSGTTVTSGGFVLVEGSGGGVGASSANNGVVVENAGTIAGTGTTSLATVTVKGFGGTEAGGSSNVGVAVTHANSQITSAGGALLVEGTGGGSDTSGYNHGVYLSAGSITGAASGSDPAVTVHGFAGTTGTGEGNCGVIVTGSAGRITSSTGSVLVHGTGGGTSSTSSNQGVRIVSGGSISSADTRAEGTVSVVGGGGNTGGGAANYGVIALGSDSTISSGGGSVDVTGVAGSGAASHGIQLQSGGRVVGVHGAPAVTLIADSMNLLSTPSVSADTGAVTLRPFGAGEKVGNPRTQINLGGNDSLASDSLVLGLTDAELDGIVAPTLIIGDSNSDVMTVSAAITRPSLTDVQLISRESIVFDPGSFDALGGTLRLAADGDIRPLSGGVDAAASTVHLIGGSSLRIDVSGTAPDIAYSQLNVAGGIDLSDVPLNIVGTPGLVGGETLTIVSNDGDEPVIGALFGLPEGTVIDDFLSSGLRATITYVGGDGNDVVITVLPPAQIVSRQIFYNNSGFDGRDAAANAGDDGAIAPGKVPLLPGAKATLANLISYSRGINGIMIDVANLTTPASLSAADFEFRVGNDNNPGVWPALQLDPALIEVSVRPGAGVDGSDRVTIRFPDGAIRKTWLQVTVKATAATGLQLPDVHYWGNVVGDSGNSQTDTAVNVIDALGVRANLRTPLNPAPIDFQYDFNRDRQVNVQDCLLVRANTSSPLTDVNLIDLR